MNTIEALRAEAEGVIWVQTFDAVNLIEVRYRPENVVVSATTIATFRISDLLDAKTARRLADETADQARQGYVANRMAQA